MVRSPCYIVQSCEQDLNTFLCFYRAKQDNSSQRVKSLFFCFSLLVYRERAFTLFPEIPWRVTIALLPRATVFSSVTGVSRGKFSVSNIHRYVKKITRSTHDIKRGKLQWCFDTQDTRANHDAPLDSNM